MPAAEILLIIPYALAAGAAMPMQQAEVLCQTAEERTFQAWLGMGELETVIQPQLPICDPVRQSE